MLVTDNDYPRFYGNDIQTYYVIPTLGARPVHVNAYGGETVLEAWPSTAYAMEADVARRYTRSRSVVGWQEVLQRREQAIRDRMQVIQDRRLTLIDKRKDPHASN